MSSRVAEAAGTISPMPDIGRTSPDEDDNLRGWKEIAQFLHSAPRTVQRWERTLGLPVHRIGTHGNAVVLASRRELDIWLDSIEVRKAMAAESGEALTPDPAAEDQADTEHAPRSRVLWAALALGIVAVLVGLVPVSYWMGWNWFGPEKKATASATAPAAGGGTGPSAPRSTEMVALRLTSDSGASNIFGIQAGATSSITLRNQSTYVFSAELVAEGARILVSRKDGETAQGTPQLFELAAITLRQGTPMLVDRIPGITAVEWVDLTTLSKNRAKASK